MQQAQRWSKWACRLGAFVVGCIAASDAAHAQPEPPFVVCREPYALCAAASCFVYDGVAYCACDIERGRSISLQLDYVTPAGDERDVCDVARAGRGNGFLVSTYSLPEDAVAGGRGAVYTCPGTANAGGGDVAPVAYAQCDGGLCFTSTIGRRFPGFTQRLARDEIVCSCPITTAASAGSASPLGYQVFGPYAPDAPPGERCDPQGCAACSVASPTANGADIKVGAATGTAELLALRLDGPPAPELNRCACRCTTDSDGATTCDLASDVP